MVADELDDIDEEIHSDVEIELDHEHTITVELNKEDTIECEVDQENTIISIVKIDQADNLHGDLDEADALKDDDGTIESSQPEDDYGTTGDTIKETLNEEKDDHNTNFRNTQVKVSFYS